MSLHTLTVEVHNWTLPLPLLAEYKSSVGTLTAVPSGGFSATAQERWYDPGNPLQARFYPYGGVAPGINHIRVPNVFPSDVAAGNPYKLGEDYASAATNAGLDPQVLAWDQDPDGLENAWFIPYDKTYRFYFKTFRLDNVWSDGVNEYPLIGRAVPLGYGRWAYSGELGQLVQQAVYTADAESWYPYQLTDNDGRATYCVLVGVAVGRHFHLEGYDRNYYGTDMPNYSFYDEFGDVFPFFPLPGSEAGWAWQLIQPDTYIETIDGIDYTRSWQNCGFYPYYREYIDALRVADTPPLKYNQYYDATWAIDYGSWSSVSGVLPVSDGAIRKRAYFQTGQVHVYELDGVTPIPCNVTFGPYSGITDEVISCVPKGSLLDNVRDSTALMTHLHLRNTTPYLNASPPQAPVHVRPPRYQYSPQIMDPDNPDFPLPFDPSDDPRAPFWGNGFADAGIPPDQTYASYISKTLTDLSDIIFWHEQEETHRLDTDPTVYLMRYAEFLGGELISEFYAVNATEIAAPHRKFKGRIWIHEDDASECTLEQFTITGGVVLQLDRIGNQYISLLREGNLSLAQKLGLSPDWKYFTVYEDSVKHWLAVDRSGLQGRIFVAFDQPDGNVYLALNESNGYGGWSVIQLAAGTSPFIYHYGRLNLLLSTYNRGGNVYLQRSQYLDGALRPVEGERLLLAGVAEQVVTLALLEYTDDVTGTLIAAYSDGDGNPQFMKSTDGGLNWSPL